MADRASCGTLPLGAVLDPWVKRLGSPKAIALFLCFIHMSAALAAPPDVVVEGTRDIWYAGEHMFVLEDASGTLTIEDVSRADFAHRFTPSPEAQPKYGFSRSVYWARFSYLKKDRVPERRWFLAVRDPNLEHVDVYFQRPDGSFDVRRAGVLVPWAKREIAHRDPVFNLPETPTEPITVYIRVQTSSIVAIPAAILTSDRLIQENADRFIPWWIYVGIVVSMVLFNAILYFFLKDRTYLYYIIYIISLGSFVGLAFKAVGHTYFPESGPLWARLWPFFGHLACLFGALFARAFLHIRRAAPRLDRLVCVLATISGISAPLALFLPARVSQITLSALALVYGPLMFIMPAIVWRRGFQPARFFLAGWCMLGVAGVFVPCVNQGWVPNNIFTQHVMLTGSAVEMILFALALANRINEAKKESEIARRHALEGEIHRLRNIELRQANEEILRKQDQLIQAEKMASMWQLTAGVAHEIKNPLNLVNNFSLSLVETMDELLQELKSLPADNQAALESLASDCKLVARKIAEHGGRADGIVRGMLEHATMRPGERCMTDLNRLIEEHLGLFHEGTLSRRPGVQVSVERDLAPGVSPVEVIPHELGRVLLNLLNNAFYAVGEQHERAPGGYVPTIRISTRGRDGHVEIRIEDNGTGIPAAARERIFEPFFTTKPPGEGVGLGLSLSYGIVTKRHGGTLGFESTENKGTTFVMTLPLRPSQALPGTGGAQARGG
ncbi:hypothetical protein HPC49_16550 [Pyxidicoccus fallax]|uniref:histidine kinase n=1 Tax=Pyxidicoccus fallax TaxID=394095 RepID=A0A848LND7_9BACT|nr:7TM diverse intracellular signaling domain-containing protein [Pyxidicoccus fallax]NMO19256.1 hypothetical protein [Pyxidicoccus fallax]NPC79827.1 hypothetical protein [Pyxidicoccus fallax]